MKNLLFGLIATVFLSGITFAQIKFAENGKEFGKIDAVEVGRLHNLYLTQAVKNAETNPNLSLKEAYMMVKIDNLIPDIQSTMFDAVEKMSANDLKKLVISKLKSDNAIRYYNSVNQAIIDSKNYEDLSSILDRIKVSVNKDLSGNDLSYILVQLETVRASGYFWTSKELGGSGVGTNYMTTHSMELRTALCKDGAGAGYGMVCWSFSAFLGPVGAAGLIYGAVSGALCSSFLP